MLVFFFDDRAATEIYTLSLHDALPISRAGGRDPRQGQRRDRRARPRPRTEEHTSELQSQSNLVCRLLLEIKKLHQASTKIEYRHISTHYQRSIEVTLAKTLTISLIPHC